MEHKNRDQFGKFGPYANKFNQMLLAKINKSYLSEQSIPH